jgi:hypothetical protein
LFFFSQKRRPPISPNDSTPTTGSSPVLFIQMTFSIDHEAHNANLNVSKRSIRLRNDNEDEWDKYGGREMRRKRGKRHLHRSIHKNASINSNT